MFPEIEKFGKWLRRKRQHTTTHRHYAGDLRLFFAWAVETLIALMGLISLKKSV